MINSEQIYGQVKNHKWSEYEIEKRLPLVFEGKCAYMSEKNIAIVFYSRGEGRPHVEVFLKKPGEPIGEQIVMYCSYEKWYKYSHYTGLNEPIPESPFEPFIPVAEVDNTMAYMNEDGMIEVFTEDGAVKWGRKYVDVCRAVLEEETDPGYLEAAKEALDNKEIEEDFRSVIALYRNYETYIRLHYPQWEEIPDDGALPKWLKEEEKKEGFRFIRRANPIGGGKP